MNKKIICCAKNISFGYGENLVFDSAKVEIEPGKIYGLLGPNGVGKTTLLNILFGQNRPTGGSVVWGTSPKDRFYVRQYIEIPQELKVGEFIEMLFRINSGDFDREKFLSGQPAAWRKKLEILFPKKIPATSFGERKWAMTVAALSLGKRVIALDEPTAAMDVPTRQGIWKKLKELKNSGSTLIVSSHYLEEFDGMADTILAIKGRKLLEFDGTKGFIDSISNLTSPTINDAFVDFYSPD